ncbi:MAG: PilC/PilY family type IV pilus protein [Methylococcaceae bacterium]|jgi:type IV pilus assembly protein PilY1
MKYLVSGHKFFWQWILGGICYAGLVTGTFAGTVAQSPLFLTTPAKPVTLLNISKDHQLYFKAFDDYSDLDGDGIPETTYKHSFDYYGYFDNHKCYDYSTANKQFEPKSVTTNKYCNGNWSGNFLNWGSMARIDTIRKILYGGYRATDTVDTTKTETVGKGKNKKTVVTIVTGYTILERTYLPNDAHSFAKFYNGTDLTSLTPFSTSDVANGITLCNTTVSTSQFSQNATEAPLIRVAKGNFSLWAANERWQCRWSGDKTSSDSNISAENGNSSASSGISASSTSPVKSSDGLGEADYIARILVCLNASLKEDNCKQYPSGALKPTGLLQTYGDNDDIRFGLVTGSYGKNKSGGVLRKNISSMTDEINVTTDGTFKTVPSAGGIINTLNKLRIYGYRNDDGTYHSTTGSDDCIWGINTFTNGQCSNWGNPQSEILLESLRYLAGNAATSAFSADDSSRLSGLTTATVVDPLSANQWCARLNVIQFNASTSSYDNDELSGATDIGASDVNALTDTVGSGESISGNNYFVGENGTDNNQLCTAKTVDKLSTVRGTCPNEPRLSGTYYSAGLAYFAHTNDIRPKDLQNQQSVIAYGVSLSPARPRITVPVPGSTDKQISILPACRNSTVSGNCAIADFKIVSQTSTASKNSGKLYINWEDSEQGGDFDQDMWGVLSYEITSTKVTVTTDVIAQSTPYAMGFGYIVGGTDKDGFHVHSGINSFKYTDASGVTACSDCKSGDSANTVSYAVGTSASAETLQQPLYYAAKWGGFVDADSSNTPNVKLEWDGNKDGVPDRFFAAIDPGQLAVSLGQAFADAAKTFGSSSSVATNSTQFQTTSLIYQARFNSADWSGQLLAINLVSEDTNNNGKLDTGEDTNGNGQLDYGLIGNTQWDAATLIPSATSRKIYGYNPESATVKGIEFKWDQLNATQQNILDSFSAANSASSSPIVDYLRGDQSKELSQPNGIYRDRSSLLGDIVNSDPVYVGYDDFGYSQLSGVEGSSYSSFRTSAAYTSRPAMIYVGSNDGMLHGFDAGNSSDGGKEIFAYLPNAVISPELVSLTTINYVHHYFVDGSPKYGDAYFSGAWHSVLVGSMGSGNTTETVGDPGFAEGVGGHSVFALDITNPSSFTVNNVLWEFSSRDDTDLGYTIPETSIVRMADGNWAAVVANGYDSTSGNATLFIINISTGDVISKLVADSGTGNGLSSPTVVDADGNGVVDYIYAGDLKGNLWKFDVTSSSPGSWVVANQGKALFVALDKSSARQAITAKPAVTKASATGQSVGYMVYFGTGKYFEVGDNVVSATPQVQTFYGIWDNCDKSSASTCDSSFSGRSLLQQQAILIEGTSGSTTLADGTVVTGNVRVTSDCEVPYDDKVPSKSTTPCTKNTKRRGWYIDLIPPSQVAAGEIAVNRPILRFGRVIFTTLVPLSDICSPGGAGWLFELNQDTGARFTDAPFDISGDKKVDPKDLVKGSDGKAVAASAIQSPVGIIKIPAIIECQDGLDCKYSSGSSGQVWQLNESRPLTTTTGSSGHRISWRQLR